MVFICNFDPFKQGLYRYSFHNVCQEDTTLELNDGAYKLFFNTNGKRGDISNDLRKVLKYINGPRVYPVNETNLTLIRAIDEAISEAKMSDGWRVAYMAYQIHQRDAELRGEKRGIAIGEQRGKILGAIETYRADDIPDVQTKDKIALRYHLTPAAVARYMTTSAQ